MSFPYLLTMKDTTTSGGSVTLSYQLANGRKLHIHDILFQSTNTFDLINMYTAAAGRELGNMSNSNPIPSGMLREDDTQNHRPKFPIEPLILEGGDTLYIEVKDTATVANTIQALLNCIMEVG